MSPSTSFQALHATGVTQRALGFFFALAQQPCYFHMPIGLTPKRKAEVALLGEGGWGNKLGPHKGLSTEDVA